MNAYGGVEVWLHAFFISALDRAVWLTSRLHRFTFGKMHPDTISIKDNCAPEPFWMLLSKACFAYPESSRNSSSPHYVPISTELPRLPNVDWNTEYWLLYRYYCIHEEM
jgi:hypothetical protein